jgi:hypothetical protein
MFETNFKENWNKIIKFNSKIGIVENPESITEDVKVPFTPIMTNTFLLYKLISYLYPLFINTQKNEADIIVSDYDIENIVLDIYLHESKSAGVYERNQRLPKGILKFNQDDLNDISSLFHEIERKIFAETSIKISSLRIHKKRFIDLIDTHNANLQRYDFTQAFTSIINVIQKAIDNNLLIIYPNPPVFRFISRLFKILGINLSKITEKTIDLVKKLDLALILADKELSFLSHIYKRQDEGINIEFLDIGKEVNYCDKNEIRRNFKYKTIAYLNLSSLIQFFLDVIELDIPIPKEELKLIFQKLLYGMRSIEFEWNISPKPKLYNVIQRWILRLMGFNLNLQKLSHWNIPEFLGNLILSRIGLYSSILLLISDNDKSSNFYDSIEYMIKIDLNNGKINRILSLNTPNIASEQISNLKSLRLKLTNDGSIPVDLIVKIDRSLFEELLNKCLINFQDLSPLSLYKTVRKFKKSKYFDVFPEFPAFMMLKKKSFTSFLKAILPVLIDRHEF